MGHPIEICRVLDQPLRYICGRVGVCSPAPNPGFRSRVPECSVSPPAAGVGEWLKAETVAVEVPEVAQVVRSVRQRPAAAVVAWLVGLARRPGHPAGL